MTSVDLAYSSAIDILKLYKTRKLSPVELLKVLINRSQKLNGKINCLADCYFDEAVSKAKAIEQNYMKRGFKPRALEGIPLSGPNRSIDTID